MAKQNHEIKIGAHFGSWVVIAAAPSQRQGAMLRRVWLCKCACGTEKIVVDYNLRKGISRSCGCSKGRIEIPKSSRFGLLKVIGFGGIRRVKHGVHKLWLCKCDCGKITLVATNNLRSGNTQSCGCLAGKNRCTHGESRKGEWSIEYTTWASIVQRVTNPKNSHYHRYGGRGITLFEPWRLSFIAFRDWVIENLGRRPSSKHSIDRKNNDGNYEPGNLRWATAKEQANNRHHGNRWTTKR